MGCRDLARASRAASVGSNDVWIALLRRHDVDAVRLHDRGGFGGRENAEVDRRSIGKGIPGCGTQLRGNGVTRVHVRD